MNGFSIGMEKREENAGSIFYDNGRLGYRLCGWRPVCGTQNKRDKIGVEKEDPGSLPGPFSFYQLP